MFHKEKIKSRAGLEKVMNRKNGLVLGFAVLGALSLASCGSTPSSGTPNAVTVGAVTVQIDSSLLSTGLSSQGLPSVDRPSVDADSEGAIALNGNTPVKFVPRQIIYHVGRGMDRLQKANALAKKLNARIVFDGSVPDAPANIPKNQLREKTPSDFVTMQVVAPHVSMSNLATVLSDQGVTGDVKVSDQATADLLAFKYANDTKDVPSSLNMLFQPQGYSEHLISGSYPALYAPPLSAKFADASDNPALKLMKVATSPNLAGTQSAWALKDKNGNYLDGTGVSIAILDHGFDTENLDMSRGDVVKNMWGTSPRIFAYDFGNRTYNVNNTSDGACAGYHGLKVAAAAAGTRDNHYGISGIAPNANLFLFDVSGGCSGISLDKSVNAVDTAIYWGASVINQSFGSYRDALYYDDPYFSFYKPIENALSRARDAGVISVASAGNDSKWIYPYALDRYTGKIWPTQLPAGFRDSVISVGAASTDLGYTNYSNFGSGVSIYGIASTDGDYGTLGRFIPSVPTKAQYSLSYTGFQSCGTYPYCSNSPLGIPMYNFGASDDTKGRQFQFSGTSQAAPEIAGVIALMKQYDRNISFLSAKKLLRDNSTKPIGGYRQTQVSEDGGVANAYATLYAMGARP
jgi:hypothetical protein